MTKYEVPVEDIYTRQEYCSFDFKTEDDFFSRRQWFFEKAYADSPYNAGISFRERFFKGDGLEQYAFFNGEVHCPDVFKQSGGDCWYELERRHWEHTPELPYVVPFVVFLRNYIADKICSEVGWDVETQGNKWLDNYLESIPYLNKTAMDKLDPELNYELNPDYLFRMTWTKLLCRIAKGEVNAQELAIMELENRGLDINGKRIGFDKNITLSSSYYTAQKTNEPMEELSDAMHATFTISDESDRKFRVWSSINLEAEGYPLAEALHMQQVTMADYDLYCDTYPNPDE